MLATPAGSAHAIAVVTNIHSFHSQNTGDIACGPATYFTFPFPVEKRPFVRNDHIFDSVILGGGGLFYAPELLKSILDRTRGLAISWGLGHNTHGGSDLIWPNFMDRFALHGIRDWNSGFNWVPCASCMHPFFDHSYPAECEAVVFEHKRYPIRIAGLPTKSNREREILPVLQFLAKAEVVITNSYHGAFWATLLGKRVVVANPFSTRFLHSRYPPAFQSGDHWAAAARSTPRYTEALGECRDANQKHFERVCDLLG